MRVSVSYLVPFILKEEKIPSGKAGLVVTMGGWVRRLSGKNPTEATLELSTLQKSGGSQTRVWVIVTWQ